MSIEDADLKHRQKAGEAVEAKMLDILLGFTAVHVLKVEDVLFIARAARGVAFDAFDPLRNS